ncbi:phytoene/squalene synthase family protein [Nocardia blacklockiae]|uniref:phytoene/squalene synthase family protein n=1 Tax=Nocardia blacklockiae TaxID=480036 RepID=UPI001893E57F|nr:phytoene/squalene synthase family protein [Nocardia blacklockiae]MBF6174125.1 phytoene/squalene synthase family protein [Nocardia blacklockiae]
MSDGPLGGRRTDSAAYRQCRAVAATHGRTYFLATRLLSPDRRPAVHALYAFARTVDDIVDHGAKDAARQLDLIEQLLRDRLGCPPPPVSQSVDEHTPLHADSSAAGSGHTSCAELHSAPVPAEWEPVLWAVGDTIERFAIAPEHFWTFLDAMRMDVPGTPLFRDHYATMDELREYMRGSAAAIGLQLLPVLGTVVPRVEAEPAAAALGEAFQLTNFLRDVGEDLDRGRVYLPAAELAAFGVDDELLAHGRRTGRTDVRLRRALAHLIATNRALYRRAAPGIDLLTPRVRPAIRTAATLYAAILDQIEHSDYAIFTTRAVVPTHRRLRTAAREFAPALLPSRRSN